MVTNFLGNKNNGKVIDELRQYIEKQSKLSIVSAYFTIYAFQELKKELLKEHPLTGYLERNMLETKSNKYPFTHVVYDSENEAKFAEQFENNKKILKYVKLPSKFLVPTPLGSYNPDLAVLVDKNGERKCYFVLETKRENLQVALDDDLRQNEKDKIRCGRKHFEALNTDAQFEVVTNFEKFIQEATK